MIGQSELFPYKNYLAQQQAEVREGLAHGLEGLIVGDDDATMDEVIRQTALYAGHLARVFAFQTGLVRPGSERFEEGVVGPRIRTDFGHQFDMAHDLPFGAEITSDTIDRIMSETADIAARLVNEQRYEDHVRVAAVQGAVRYFENQEQGD